MMNPHLSPLPSVSALAHQIPVHPSPTPPPTARPPNNRTARYKQQQISFSTPHHPNIHHHHHNPQTNLHSFIPSVASSSSPQVTHSTSLTHPTIMPQRTSPTLHMPYTGGVAVEIPNHPHLPVQNTSPPRLQSPISHLQSPTLNTPTPQSPLASLQPPVSHPHNTPPRQSPVHYAHHPAPHTLQPSFPSPQPQTHPSNSPLPNLHPSPLCVSNPSAQQYWRRLHRLLLQASDRTKVLRVDPSVHPASDTPYRLACHLQGLFSSQVQLLLSQHPEYQTLYQDRSAGNFVEYGVSDNHAAWVAYGLSIVEPERKPPPLSSITMTPPIAADAAHQCVEDVRVRVFEAEVAYLPMHLVEALLKARRSMRKFRSRIELCVRILCAMEGRGRRMATAALDKLKLQFEKAEVAAKLEATKEAEKEVLRKEKELSKMKKVKKTKADQKKRRRQSAQASFMMKFVKKDGEASSQSLPPDSKQSKESNYDHTSPESLGLAWRLQAELCMSSVGCIDQSSSTSHLRQQTVQQHVQYCSERRRIALRQLQTVLAEQHELQRGNGMDQSVLRFSMQRSQLRGRGVTGPVKLLQFEEDIRPAFYGTFSARSKYVSARRPFGKDSSLDYEYDSADEWEEEDEGEDLLDVEADKELASEEAELRRLYGSDDEDDDDFLDDADAVDDDNDSDIADGEVEGISENTDSPPERIGSNAGNAPSTPVVDLTTKIQKSSMPELSAKRKSSVASCGTQGKKRRKSSGKRHVSIIGLSLPNGSPCQLDKYPVASIFKPQQIQMFNPFVYHHSTIAAEHLKAKAPSMKASRSRTMDEEARLGLAAALLRGGTREEILTQFCEDRRKRGLKVPKKTEVNRAIGEMATWEKREGDLRPKWNLIDEKLVGKVQAMAVSSNGFSMM